MPHSFLLLLKMSIPLQELGTHNDYLIQPQDLQVEDYDDLLIDPSRDTYEEETTTLSTILDAAFNFTNSIVGAGIIGLPYALKQAGSITGIFLLIFLTFLVDQTVILLVQDGKLAGQSTYQGLTQYCFGNKGFIAISFFQFIFAYGAMCAYTVILGDTIPKVFQQILPQNSILSPLASRSFMIIFCTLLVSLPLSLNRDVSALAKTSAVSLGMIVFMIGAGFWI
jgi:sodium-coupled neutral amino acid transporter 11